MRACSALALLSWPLIPSCVCWSLKRRLPHATKPRIQPEETWTRTFAMREPTRTELPKEMKTRRKLLFYPRKSRTTTRSPQINQPLHKRSSCFRASNTLVWSLLSSFQAYKPSFLALSTL